MVNTPRVSVYAVLSIIPMIQMETSLLLLSNIELGLLPS